MAKCLDGTPMAYYHRAGKGEGANKWLLSYEGKEEVGGWVEFTCMHYVSSSSREKRRSSSLSLLFPPTHPPTHSTCLHTYEGVDARPSMIALIGHCFPSLLFTHPPTHPSPSLQYIGGGWCSTLDDCSYRTLGPLGSSKDYKSTTPLLLGR